MGATAGPSSGARRASPSVRPLELAAVAGYCLVLVLVLLARTDLKTRGTAAFADPGWDRHLYIEMARSPLDFHLAPYCWRILVPALARLSPLDGQATFLGIAVAAAAGAGVALYALARRSGAPLMAAVAAPLLLYGAGWATKFQLADFWVPDSAAFLLVATAMFFAARRRPVAFAVTVAIAAACKESSLVVLPLYYTLNVSRGAQRRLIAETALAALPAILVTVALRLLIPAYNGDAAYIATLPPEISRFPDLFPPYEVGRLIQETGYEQRYLNFQASDLRLYTFGTFGLVLPALATWGCLGRPGLALRLSPFFLLVYCQLLVATDTQRLLALAVPGLIFLALGGIPWNGRRRLAAPVVLAAAIAVYAFALVYRHRYGPLVAWEAPIAVALTLLAAADIIARRRARSSQPDNARFA